MSENLDRQHVKHARWLNETMQTDGWKNIVEPLIDKMIRDVVGYKKDNGEWVSGSFGDSRIGEAKATNLLWYREALINLNNHLHSYFKVAEMAKKRLEAKNKKTKSVHPMKNSRYGSNVDMVKFSDKYEGGGTIG